MGTRLRRALLAVGLAGPLVALGVCGSLAPLVLPPAVCAADTAGSESCCPRSGGPSSPRTPAPERCAACGAAACAMEDVRQAPAAARPETPTTRSARPAAAPVLAESTAERLLLVVAASPPRNLLLATFRN